MIPRTKNFRGWFGTWFSDTSQDPEPYIEGCESAPHWLAKGNTSFAEFRDELAVHIRDSSYPALRNTSQWSTDEWLRSIWYDVFGPEPPPQDPYPVPSDYWGRIRLTSYMLHAVDDEPDWGSPGAPDWLAQRGLTAEGVYNVRSHEMQNARPQPPDFIRHLEHLTKAGLREPQPGEPSAP